MHQTYAPSKVVDDFKATNLISFFRIHAYQFHQTQTKKSFFLFSSFLVWKKIFVRENKLSSLNMIIFAVIKQLQMGFSPFTHQSFFFAYTSQNSYIQFWKKLIKRTYGTCVSNLCNSKYKKYRINNTFFSNTNISVNYVNVQDYGQGKSNV